MAATIPTPVSSTTSALTFLTQAEKDSETEVLNPDESGQTTAGLEELDGIQSETEGGSDDGH